MHIKKIKSQRRRDFTAEYECEHCGYEEISSGYDDRHFHEQVVPNMTCPVCQKKANPERHVRAPRYPEGQQL